MHIEVWEKGDGRVYFDTKSGDFSADMSGWWGPTDFTLVGIYTLIGDKTKDFNQFVDEIMTKIPEEHQDKVVIEPTSSDLFWVYFGNRNYFTLTGKQGQEPPWDEYILDDEEREEYYVTWDGEEMEKAIDDFIAKVSAGKSPEDLAEDGNAKDTWYSEFIDYALSNVNFTKEKL